MPAGFEGGQTRLFMRLPKLPGSTSKDAMPIGPFRTHTQGVNVRDLERVFDAGAEVTPESLKANRLIRTTRIDVKILGHGDLTKKLTVSTHGVSKSAREKIEGAGGTITLLREPKERKRKRHKKAAPVEAEAETQDAEESEGAEESAEPSVGEPGAEAEPEPEEE
jgi:ribosomal protein L15